MRLFLFLWGRCSLASWCASNLEVAIARQLQQERAGIIHILHRYRGEYAGPSWRGNLAHDIHSYSLECDGSDEWYERMNL
ncbi:hypothetical protein OE88DRAFT_1656809 [Heliocybe sulcata]|uniref:Secreted protein n=1 Tax=Heliocybe sulcata TaxID=5364 RepID=A0A5C3N5E6_9AGAM|nr:hypothetical protein OE88DRAFT_1656809 [Heliocybe sulcata]